MTNIEKKICPRCNYLGKDKDTTCPFCGLKLISQCPKCGTQIKAAFAKYCYICGFRFENVTNAADTREEENGKEISSFIDSNPRITPGFEQKLRNKLEE